jgi:hypothetical protein
MGGLGGHKISIGGGLWPQAVVKGGHLQAQGVLSQEVQEDARIQAT